MNLSLRLITAILILVFLVVLAGSMLAIRNAKLTIQTELDKNSSLGLNLFSIAVINEQNSTSNSLGVILKQLEPLDIIKTLNVAVTQPSQTLIRFASKNPDQLTEQIPDWFLNLVTPTPKEYHRRLVLPGKPPITIRVVPDPANELIQAWNNLRLLLLLSLSFAVVSIPLIWLVIRLGLKPLDQVLNALDVVRDGNYQLRLPDFRLTDVRKLSHGFNRMAEVLEEQKEENRLLNTQLLEVQENERRYLARELHDELGQSINGIKSLAVSFGRRDEAFREPMQSIRQVCDQMHQAVRDMINLLRPSILDELGLTAALEKLVDDWNSHHEDTFCALHIQGSLDGLDEKDAITIYRIVQESLTNVARHAEAEKVSVNIDIEADNLTLTITDDGIGLHEKEHYRGRGLPGIKERVSARGGSFKVTSEINQGVALVIQLPINVDDGNQNQSQLSE